MYPSDAIPPRLYGFLKAHKPNKNFPMRPVVSTVGTPFYGTSKYLVELLQPTLNKNVTRVKNSSTFAEEAKSWEISLSEVQVSYDVVNLYPSVPIDKSIQVVVDLAKEDYQDLKLRTKLNIEDIEKLLRLCLSKCYFLWDDKIYVIENAGPIGLSVMVTMAEAYLQFLEKKALQTALYCSPKTFRRYVDDSHVRFENESQPDEFLTILNAQDTKIQYTMEKEDSESVLAFLDISIRNTKTGKYELGIFRKEAITNLQIRPESSFNPSMVVGVFKGFLSRAYKICSDEKIEEEVEFLISMFAEHGYERSKFQRIAEDFKQNILLEQNDVAHDEEMEKQEEEVTPVVKLPWMPIIGPKLRAAFRKHDVKVIFTAGPNLKDLLSQHKCPLPKNSQPGVYRLECNCSAIYIGETKKRVSTRVTQHERDIFNGRWQMSGASEHAKVCDQGFKFQDATTVSVERFYFQRKVREAVEIRTQRRSLAPVLNRDSGSYLRSSQWDVLLAKVTEN